MRISEDIEKQSQQKNTLTLIDNWKTGKSPDNSPLQQEAYKLFKISLSNYTDAKHSMDAEIFDAYYRQVRTSLLSAIDCVYILVMNSSENMNLIDYFEKIDQLFAKKIVVNPIMIDKLDNVVQKLEDGVEIQPNQRFFQDVFEYLEKNLANLKFI